jgi:hypothetical protein
MRFLMRDFRAENAIRFAGIGFEDHNRPVAMKERESKERFSKCVRPDIKTLLWT